MRRQHARELTCIPQNPFATTRDSRSLLQIEQRKLNVHLVGQSTANKSGVDEGLDARPPPHCFAEVSDEARMGGKG
jgi:hypothetical protein